MPAAVAGRLGSAAQVAIVLFRTLVEFYDTPLGLSTLPLIVWRFATIGIGSILTGKHLRMYQTGLL